MKKGIMCILSGLIGMGAGAALTSQIRKGDSKNNNKKVDKFRSYYNVLNQWLLLKNEGKSLADYFVNNSYKNIAVYGMGELGNRLIEELKSSDINVRYGIDKNVQSVYSEIEVIDLESKIENVDVIVVTAVFAFEEIENELSKRTDMPIVSLEEVIYEI